MKKLTFCDGTHLADSDRVVTVYAHMLFVTVIFVTTG